MKAIGKTYLMRLLMMVMMAVLVVAAAAPAAMADPVQGTTSDGSLDVRITPGASNFVMEFLVPTTDRLQEHVDYTVEVSNAGSQIFGPIPLTHTTPGKVTIPAILQDGTNEITVSIQGILFQPIPEETLTIEVSVGEEAVPAWIRTNAGWWADGQIDDATFLAGIQYMINEEIISVDASGSEDSSGEIPGWVKSTAGWWADGQVSDADFVNALSYLIENGIISVAAEAGAPLVIGGVDLSQASPPRGSEDAPVTMIEFGDYQCPKCKAWFDDTKPTIDTNYIDAGTVRLYFVDIRYIGGDSVTATVATYCAQEQDMYWEYHDTLYENQGSVHGGWASRDNLVRFAGNIGLDTDEFSACMRMSEHQDRLDFNTAQATAQNIRNTPQFIIVGPGGVEHIAGAQPYSIFDRVIEDLQN